MRSVAVVSGLALAGALTFALAAVPRGPGPETIVRLAPDAAARMAEVTPGVLAAHTIEALKAFARKPVRGFRDKNSKDRLRAWSWSYTARAALLLYRETGDVRLISPLPGLFQAYADEARRSGGWYTDDKATGARYRESPIVGLIAAPMVDMLLLAHTDENAARALAGAGPGLLAVIESELAKLRTDYVEDRGHGFMRLPRGDDVQPLNLASVYAEPLIGLWQLTGNKEYLRQVTGVAATWKAVLAANPTAPPIWPYVPRPSPDDLLAGPAERLMKSAAGIVFAKAAHEAGIVLETKDLLRLAALPGTTFIEPAGKDSVRIRARIDPSYAEYLRPDARDTDNPRALGAWYIFTCLDPAVPGGLDPVLLGIDEKFWRTYRLALYALAMRRLEEAQGRCAATARVAAR